MGRPLRIEYPGAYYHVTSRGNEQKDVFKSRRDREKFLSYLESATERYGAAVHAYCMMSNHYHLLLETPSGNLSQIMRHINGAYTNYFNTKRKRAGHLFQGRYKAILVDKDAYALELTRYIHLNPVRAGMAERPEEYNWSSYRSYIGLVEKPMWLQSTDLLGQFSKDKRKQHEKYKSFVEELHGKDKKSPLDGTIGSAILGDQWFVAEIETTHIEGKRCDCDIPDLRRITSRWSLDAVLESVRGTFKEDSSLAKKVSIYLCHRYSGARLKEIGEKFGISASGVSQVSRRLAGQIKEDGQLRKVVDGIHKRLKDVNVQT